MAHWMKDLDEALKASGIVGSDPLFPSDLTDEEARAGFTRAAIPNPSSHYFGAAAEIRAVVRKLGADRVAVKMSGPSGVEYAIWNDQQRPVEQVASLGEITRRYPLPVLREPAPKRPLYQAR